jgi:hypothetical protein
VAKTVEGRKKCNYSALCLSLEKINIIAVAEMLTLNVDIKNPNYFLKNYVCDPEKLINTKIV